MSNSARSGRLGVVLVTWNVRALALEALRSLFADLDANGPDADVYVVDSASSDGTAEAIAAAFPRVRLTTSRENLGFGKANNLALQQMGFTKSLTSGSAERGENSNLSGGGARRGAPLPANQSHLQLSERLLDDNEYYHEYAPADQPYTSPPDAVYLLNPDTITQPGATRTLNDTLMADSRLGLVGARLVYGDGSFQHSAFGFPGLRQVWTEFFPTPGRFIEGRFNGRYPRSLYDTGKPFPVDFVLGATMMLRREVIEQTGMFDEAFFMYCEEIDWAWRIHKAGWDVRCVPAACVTHLGGQSTGQVRPQSVVNLWTSRLRLHHKHQPAWKAFAARMLIASGMQRKIRDVRRVAGQPNAERASVIGAYEAIYRKALHGE